MKKPEGYSCPECGKGIVKQKAFYGYKTKIDNHSFVVPKAYIDVCDTCGCKIYSPQERRRWTDLFYQGKEKTMAMNFWETNEGFLALKRLRESIETHTTVMAECLEKIRGAIEDNTRSLQDIKKEINK